jgi:nucleotide-binding universal stress UspA family protein
MKFKPAPKSDGVVVKLKRDEALGVVSTPETANEPLPIFKLRRILVPVDFSNCSKKALQYAVPFARQFEAGIVLLYVVQPYIPVPEMSTVDVGLVQMQMREGGLKELAALKDTVAAEVPVETVMRMGNPHLEIIRAARELGIDLIVLSTHGRSGLAHVFMGSVTERVVRHASCPVLVVREGEHEFVDLPAKTPAQTRRPKSRARTSAREPVPAS